MLVQFATRQASGPLFKNTIFLMLASLIASGTGMVFWMLVTRFYSTDSVGTASAMLAAIALLSGFSHLGLSIGLIRFLPEEQKKGHMVNFSYLLVAGVALVASAIFLAGLSLWSPELEFIRHSAAKVVMFVLFTVGTVILLIQRTVFIGLRESKYVLFQQSLLGVLKLAVPVALVSFAAFGIVTSYGIATWVTLLVFLVLLRKVLKDYRPFELARAGSMKRLLKFSLGQYVAENLGQLPSFLLPLIALNTLGSESNAFYYVAFLMMMLLYAIPTSAASAFFAESSNDPQQLRDHMTRAFKICLFILVPAVAIFALAGNKILLLFGHDYSEGSFQALRLMALSAFPYAFNEIWITSRRVQKKTAPVILTYALIAALVLSASTILMRTWGLIGIGAGWLAGEGIVAAILGILTLKRGL